MVLKFDQLFGPKPGPSPNNYYCSLPKVFTQANFDSSRNILTTLKMCVFNANIYEYAMIFHIPYSQEYINYEYIHMSLFSYCKIELGRWLT